MSHLTPQGSPASAAQSSMSAGNGMHSPSPAGETLRASSYAATEQAVKSLFQETPPNPTWIALSKSLKEALARELLARLNRLCPDHALDAVLCDRNNLTPHIEVMIDAYGIAARFSDSFVENYHQKLERFCESAQPPISKADFTRIRTLPSHDLCRNFGASPEEALEWFNNRVLSAQNRVKSPTAA